MTLITFPFLTKFLIHAMERFETVPSSCVSNNANLYFGVASLWPLSLRKLRIIRNTNYMYIM